MYIKNIKIKNYKSFDDSHEIEFQPGFNIIFGKNDSGKTALLEGLSLRFTFKPHRSFETAPYEISPPRPVSSVNATFNLTSSDIEYFVSFLQSVGIPSRTKSHAEDVAQFVRTLQNGGELISNWVNSDLQSAWFIDHGGAEGSLLQYTNNAFPLGVDVDPTPASGGGAMYGAVMGAQLRENVYSFTAQRRSRGRSPVADIAALAGDASNLAQVLNLLISSNTARYEALMSMLREVFPHIKHITVPIEGGAAHVKVWSHSKESQREDLAVSLDDSGTGIGHVLAMLYVLVTARRPQVFLIDEPQSFLHPGAVRKLVDILRTHPHQYIMTTHTPIGAFGPSEAGMFLVRREGFVSTVTVLEGAGQNELEIFLAEVGARLSDVFGSDCILWVEGKTEERCFPEIIRRAGSRQLLGVQILGVVNTGDFEGKLAQKVTDVYQRLSGGAALLPAALKFLFDREGKSEAQRIDLERQTGGLVTWLPARMYENYLLIPTAVAKILNAEDSLRETPLTSDDVRGMFAKYATERAMFAPFANVPRDDATWMEKVNGARMLKSVFSEASMNRIPYSKVRHGFLLTDELLNAPTDDLTALATFLVGLLPSST